MTRNPEFYFSTYRHAGARGWKNHQIERRPHSDEANLVEYLSVTIEIVEECSVGTQLSRAGPSPRFWRTKTCSPRALFRHRNRNKALHTGDTAQPLQIVAANDPAHTKANEIAPRIMRHICVDEI